MSGDHPVQWEAIVGISRAMLEDARTNQWAALHAKEDERRGLLNRYFAAPVKPDAVDAVRRGIEEMLQVNAEIIRLGGETQRALLDAFSQLGAAKRASGAYLKNT